MARDFENIHDLDDLSDDDLRDLVRDWLRQQSGIDADDVGVHVDPEAARAESRIAGVAFTGSVETAKRINLALQGGGAHSAYVWGVVDRLSPHVAVLDDLDLTRLEVARTWARTVLKPTASRKSAGTTQPGTTLQPVQPGTASQPQTPPQQTGTTSKASTSSSGSRRPWTPVWPSKAKPIVPYRGA